MSFSTTRVSRSSSTTSACPTSGARRSTTSTASWVPASPCTTPTPCTRARAGTRSTPGTTRAALRPAAAGTRRLREALLLALGVLTPIGILAVNVSAFVMANLPAFRLVIAGCALVSGLVLNGLTAWWLLRLASRNANPMYREYRTWAIGIATLIVALTAGGGGYLTYLGMRDPTHLPDSLSMIVAYFMLLLPLAVFVTLPRAAGRLGAFSDNPNAWRDNIRALGRVVFAADDRKANDSL